jgi:hypothetical protein
MTEFSNTSSHVSQLDIHLVDSTLEGGTTMRGIVHQFCESRHFNMTGNYKGDIAFGRKTNQDTYNEGEGVWSVVLSLIAVQCSVV